MQHPKAESSSAVPPGFSQILGAIVSLDCARAIDPLASLPYASELSAKNAALMEFWKRNALPGVPEAVAASPRQRHYRTTSKRRIRLSDSLVYFGYDEQAHRNAPLVAESVLEPLEHGGIYRFLHEKISAPPYRHLARHLNYLIIRGTYKEFCVIFNVDDQDAGIVRKIKLLAGHLQTAMPAVTSALVYHDPLRSRYYFEQFAPETPMRTKHLYGRETLMTAFGGRRYVYAPTVFSQVNESMLPVMGEVAGSMAGHGGRLMDLYCGYGLFSHYLAGAFQEIIGVDANAVAIDAATRNIRLNPAQAKRTFIARDITGRSLAAVFKGRQSDAESVLLDPPRQGTAPGVIDFLASRAPRRVVHIFCNVDEVPRSLQEWRQGGYGPDRVAPLDMFPGTPNLEVVAGLVRMRG
jgi:tRNA/tmRNA/rRNA uracil-C5-methylase (TrmA/RlmC/RlmD family)